MMELAVTERSNVSGSLFFALKTGSRNSLVTDTVVDLLCQYHWKSLLQTDTLRRSIMQKHQGNLGGLQLTPIFFNESTLPVSKYKARLKHWFYWIELRNSSVERTKATVLYQCIWCCINTDSKFYTCTAIVFSIKFCQNHAPYLLYLWR